MDQFQVNNNHTREMSLIVYDVFFINFKQNQRNDLKAHSHVSHLKMMINTFLQYVKSPFHY